MNRFVLPALLASLVSSHGWLSAADIAEIDRKIGTEPAYQSPHKYCLITFGRQAEHHVWLVHDGNTLYIDRNGNGDLTEPDERVQAKEDDRYATTFEVGEVRVGSRMHKGFRVEVTFSQENPETRHYRLQIDLDHPGRLGRGIGGRVEHNVWRDSNGFLEFADTAELAPVVHFEGPWEITLLEKPRLVLGRSTELRLAIGSPGIGAGTTAYVGHEGVVPEGLCPEVQISYSPSSAAEVPVRERTDVEHRCCMILFHDSVNVPETASPGPATIDVSFDAWTEGDVAPSRHEVDVLPAPRGPKPEPVSKRLKRTLLHPSGLGLIPMIAWSPDGRRVAARHRSTGVIQIWDSASGKELVKIETGQRGDNSPEFAVTRDWGTLFVARYETGDRILRVERDGKKLFHWQYAGEIRAWDLSTGQLRRKFRHAPPRAEFWADLAPDGSTFATFEWLSGEGEEPPAAASVWDVRSGEVRDLGKCIPRAYSPDGRTLLAQTENDKRYIDSIKLLRMPDAGEIVSIPIREDNAQRIVEIAFSPDGRRLVGLVRDETKSGQHWLKFWDPVAGREVASIAGDPRDYYVSLAFSADSRLLAVRNVGRAPQTVQLLLFDVMSGSLLKNIPFTPNRIRFRHVFSPDAKWLTVVTQALPEDVQVRSSPDDFAQPQIQLIEVATGEVGDTISAPPAFPEAICFSPDGQTLASSGNGCLHLWDLANPAIGPTSANP